MQSLCLYLFLAKLYKGYVCYRAFSMQFSLARMSQKPSEKVYSLFLWIFLVSKFPEAVSENARFLPNGFPVGSTAIIKGIPIAGADYKALGINLLTYSPYGESGDMAFHLAARYGDGTIATNTWLQGHGWQHEQLNGNSPIQGGQPFEIMIMAEPAHFSVYVNGKHFLNFAYRMPLQRIKYVHVVASVTVTSITVDDVTGHAWPLPNGFPVGSRALITGIPRAYASEQVFSLNFLTYSPFGSTGDIACQIAARYGEGNIASNNFVHNTGWQQEQLARDTPIRGGRPIKIVILSEPSYFSVFINYSHIFDFTHRVPTDKIKFFQIRGNIDISSITIDKKPFDSPDAN